MIRRQRFDIKDVEPGAGDFAVLLSGPKTALA